MPSTRPNPPTLPPALQSLAAMALLLEKLERQPRKASATQYRQVAAQVQRLLGQAQPGPAFEQLLQTLPAMAELYENLHYAHAGLCRAPLQPALDAELSAGAAIRRARGMA
ncbi:hypothetical protein [Aquabacterium sp. OR-4]|uniref:hypothetical protein n=1 Tax=Aquabacterium sp. OR-4 TaxID=2978127 RepID=UPI0021B29F68|nr:hypothetical protein [Aquabacterium sp. OR-4]MDT7838512.1 hypothetical protein [Aquabacterium sp. OR-4]